MIHLENTMTRFDNNYELLLLIVDICYAAISCIYISFTLQGLFPYDLFVKLYTWKEVELLPCGLVNCGNRSVEKIHNFIETKLINQ